MESRKVGIVKKKTTRKGRKILSVAQKLRIIHRLDRGDRSRDVCAAFNLASSTVRTIYLNREKILDVAQSSASCAHLYRVTKSRDVVLDQVEKLLLHWIDSHERDQSVLQYNAVKEKALTLFRDLKKKAKADGVMVTPDLDFKASHGWYERFKGRARLPDAKAKKDDTSKTVPELIRSFQDEIQEIVEKECYSPKQIFSIDEVGLFWKKIPCHADEDDNDDLPPGFGDFNERLSILLGTNLIGDIKLKPLLVNCSKAPSQEIDESIAGIEADDSFPVLWYWNGKVRVDYQIFTHYLTTYVSPLVEEHCSEHRLDNKALLILDNSPWYPRNVEDITPNIRVVFLPQNISSELHPLKQGIGATFKARYLKFLLLEAASNVGFSDETVLTNFLRNYKLRQAVEKMTTAWEQIEQKYVNWCWQNVLPKMIHYKSPAVKNDVDEILHSIVRSCHESGLSNIDREDIDLVLAFNGSELTNEQLIQLFDSKPKELDEFNCEMNGSGPLDQHLLDSVFSHADKMTRLICEYDPDSERSSCFRKRLNEALACYRDMYENQELREGSAATPDGNYSCSFKTSLSVPPVLEQEFWSLPENGSSGDTGEEILPE